MVNSLNSTLLNTLYGGGTTSVDAGLLTAWAKARAGIGASTTATQDPNAPLAPVWTPGISPDASVLVQRALAQKPFFDVGAKLYSDLGATGDYKNLFALYSGLTTLQALAGRAEDTKLSKPDQAQTLAQFSRGLEELKAFFAQQQFEDIRLAQTDRVDSAQTTLALPVKSEDYTTGVIHRGGLYQTVTNLAADAKFDIVATSSVGTERRVAIDLAQMGSIPRTLGNVVSFINGRLAAAGAASRIETVDQTPKETNIVLGGRTITQRYTGPKQYALKVDVRAGERVAFEPVASKPAFYVVGDVNGGARLIKLEDTGGATGQPTWLERPDATTDPIGGSIGAGYTSGVYEQRSNVLMSAGTNKFEDALRAAGEAVLKMQLADGRTLSLSTGWRAGDQEAWLGADDASMMGDLAQRLTQMLHEQGVAANVVAWADGDTHGLSVMSGDGVAASSLTLGGKAVVFETQELPGMVGGLRDGVFARRLETGVVATAGELFVEDQRFTFTTAAGSQTITIDGGENGIDAATLMQRVNEQLRNRNIAAAAYLVEDSGNLTLRIDAHHDVLGVSANVNETQHTGALQAPGAWVSGGLPVAGAGEPFGDAVRTWNAAAPPLLTHTGALDVEVVVATPTGNKSVTVSVSALERANDPDVAPGQWSAAFQARLDTALNEAGLYVSADGGDLSAWRTAEGAGHRLLSVKVNGDTLSLAADAPSGGLGGAFSVERSFTGANAATGVGDDVAALLSDQNVSITFDTAWGARTVTATLQPGDPRTLESAALRLNEALAAQGYDVGVEAVALSGGGASLRVATGASHTVRGVSEINLGGDTHALTLDPVDATTHGGNPPGALRVYDRAARGAAVTETSPGSSPFSAPVGATSNWFPGRAFDVSIGGGAKVATAQAVATGPDGAVYVLADLSGDSAASAIKGARDVALMKYDSAGKLVFTQMLGASDSASGFALAVSAEGKVAVAGKVEGELSGAGRERGGADTFVSLFDANGKEVWTQRRGATANDEARAVAFAPDGSVIVAGRTDSALGPALAAGGADGFVRGFSASGLELFTRQFGTGGADAATALLVRDNGSGGMEIVTGGVESNRGVLRSFSYAGGTGFSAGAVRDIGYFHNGAINALVADGASLYVGGEAGADRLTVGATARASAAGQEGFVARLNADLVSTNLDRTSYVGSAQADAVKSLAIVNGDVYAAGLAGGAMAGVGNANGASSFIARLDDAGEVAWARSFLSGSGAMSVTSLAVDAAGVSALDVLGLPRGAIAAGDTAALVNRSALRVGDEFQIGVDGRRLTTIRITATDTLPSLLNTINRAIGAGGRASIVRENGIERIKIEPRGGAALRLEPGRDGRDALQGLGLNQGIVAVNAKTRGSVKTFGLGLVAADLRLDSKAAITATKAELSAAVSIVRQAYETLLNPNAKEQTAEEKALEARRLAGGAVPEYYSAQLANYQAALARLTGG